MQLGTSLGRGNAIGRGLKIFSHALL
jgi:hypothetical protein